MPNGFRLCRAKAVGRFAKRAGHGVDDVIRERRDKRDDHDAHGQTSRERGFRRNVEAHAIAAAPQHGGHNESGEEAVDDRWDAGEQFDKRFDDAACFVRRIFGEIDC